MCRDAAAGRWRLAGGIGWNPGADGGRAGFSAGAVCGWCVVCPGGAAGPHISFFLSLALPEVGKRKKLHTTAGGTAIDSPPLPLDALVLVLAPNVLHFDILTLHCTVLYSALVLLLLLLRYCYCYCYWDCDCDAEVYSLLSHKDFINTHRIQGKANAAQGKTSPPPSISP